MCIQWILIKLYVIHYNKEQLLLAQGAGAGSVLWEAHCMQKQQYTEA